MSCGGSHASPCSSRPCCGAARWWRRWRGRRGRRPALGGPGRGGGGPRGGGGGAGPGGGEEGEPAGGGGGGGAAQKGGGGGPTAPPPADMQPIGWDLRADQVQVPAGRITRPGAGLRG